ncbi:DnaJ-domain-containing protein [Saitoella complicata NRRL Y-17804]|uniref:J domain-containing protein n=1 Tax=Saitoella complicata (strain BCRC 22490 / CBS 7301 / JCM 7358 / NBRC 10748 / NRRL Y-17804) TaxID=698492 RepID=A0A0E9NIQ2_SAICN|nr:DnaJ-domain-containing protein [Saitoella complicata NRRL Y-17804]ODQ52176.1 DnaJ-domain-containing protein [Saitoella complicata NRRL Y-17804]GAO49556.1 hypothetical protein G7K_3705-t1 [Saitoella complicata NRRL Y-17804]
MNRVYTSLRALRRSFFEVRSLQQPYGIVYHKRWASTVPDDLAWPTKPNPDPYDIFHLTQTSTPADIKTRYRVLVLQHHPDRGGSSNQFHMLQEAYKILSSPSKRRSYDAYGFGWHSPEKKMNRGYAQPDYNPSFMGAWKSEIKHKRSNGMGAAAWEHYYPEEKLQKDPVYMSHGNFAAFIVLIVFIFTGFQLYIVGSTSEVLRLGADKAHMEAARNLAEARRRPQGLNKDQQIELARLLHEGQIKEWKLREPEVCRNGVHEQTRIRALPPPPSSGEHAATAHV